MRILRVIAVLGAIVIMLGELYRSWGVDRPLVFVLDDMLAGAMMVSAAWLAGRETVARRAYFSAAWGVAVGLLYGSFFGKLYDPAGSQAGNFDIGTLTIVLGLAFVLAVGGLIASILLPRREATADSTMPPRS